LQDEMRRCERCPEAGFKVIGHAVFSGAVGARWMVVGQAPGRREMDTGVPFCGPSGRRLFHWLAEAGWEEEALRATQYITAVTKCFPGKGAGGRGDRAPSRAERELCAPFLDRELDVVRPRVVVAVGGLAIERFLGPGPLDARVGRQFSASERIVVPLPHPSGANLWLNRPESRERLACALDILGRLRGSETS
jgi:uracil-DNA glycosylase